MATSPPMRRPALLALTCVVLAAACGGDDRLFETLSPGQSGIDFANTITTSDSVNVQSDVYVYNGAGVAVGDIDNDGLLDVFFAGNMVSSRLYRNTGKMRFQDITKSAGVGTTRWATGVSMVDINGDGWLDIHVSVSGPEWSKPEDRANLLFINNRNGTFTESAEKYGLADRGFTTHAAFLDYDGDGCLDVFLLNNSPKDFSRSDIGRQPSGMRIETPGSHNELYRNGCDGTFTNVSDRAGILREAGYGLGVVVADLDRDGRPDIYVSNDAAPNDVIYRNNGGGTFTNRAGDWLKHSSVAGMGVDAADVDGDGWPDILQADMMPADLARRKRMSGYLTFQQMHDARGRGLRDDYSINSLQLSNGFAPDGGPLFSEIGRLAGVSHTDWSWSTLFADFDNDGRKDVFIGNGYPKAVNDLDYVYAALSARSRERDGGSRRPALELLRNLPAYHVTNYFFRNEGDLAFSDRSKAWGIEEPSFSYGAAYADLDNDGRLDLVVNNIDAPASVLRNVGARRDVGHWLRVQLEGEGANRRGLGATVVLRAGGRKQYLYQSPYRGYMSTVDDRLHFGLGAAARVDSLEVTWPDGRHQLLTAVDADRAITLRQRDATVPVRTVDDSFAPKRFSRLPVGRAPVYLPPRTPPNDFSVQPLLPYLVSHRGPPIAVGDADGDGLEDVFVGSVSQGSRKLFLQRADGSFAESRIAQPWASEGGFGDWGALFFDANGDGRQDLYIASGSYEAAPESPELQDRLYINQGGGRFARDPDALPEMLASKATVRAADFDGDGRLDLFVGGRLAPRSWPLPTRSYILHNDGGRFSDVTERVAPELVTPGGMVTDAQWLDVDSDRDLDLVTVGEWAGIEIYRNDGGRLRRATAELLPAPLRGWWYSLAAGDFNGDGRTDLVAGNLGLNYSYTTSRESRFGLYAADFTGSRRTDVVLTQEIGGVEYPSGGMASLGQAIYTLPIRFPTHGAFAAASMPQLFGEAVLRDALHYQADTFASILLRNDGGKRFVASPLPALAQISPIRGIVVQDVDHDGKLDVVVAGNLYDAEPNTPRADAGNGLWLRGDGKGGFQPVSPRESGFLAPGNVTGLAAVKTNTGVGIIIANAGDSLQTWLIRTP